MKDATRPPALDTLKAAHDEAKAFRREAVKAVLDAKRVANAARRRESETFAAYNAAFPRPARPRPARIERPDAGDVFAPSPAREPHAA